MNKKIVTRVMKLIHLGDNFFRIFSRDSSKLLSSKLLCFTMQYIPCIFLCNNKIRYKIVITLHKKLFIWSGNLSIYRDS